MTKQGDALPPEKEWDNMTLDDQLAKLASDLEDCVHTNAPKTQYFIDPYDVDQVRASLEELSERVFRFRRSTGIEI